MSVQLQNPDSCLNDPLRLAALRSYNIIDTAAEPAFDRLTQIAAGIAQVPFALLSVLDNKRQWFKAKEGVEGIDEVPVNYTFCQYALMEKSLLEISHVSAHETLSQRPIQYQGRSIEFYAGIPLIDEDGYAIGSLCVLDFIPHKLDAMQKRNLKLLAETALTLITQRRSREEAGFFEQLFSQCGDLVCLLNPEGELRKVNPAFLSAGSLRADDVRKTLFLDLVHPEDRGKTEAAFRRLFEEKSLTGFENRMRSSRHGYDICRWGFSYEAGTGCLFAVGTVITTDLIQRADLKQSKELVEQAARLGRLGGWEYDASTERISWSAMAREMHQVTYDFEPTLATALHFVREGVSRDRFSSVLQRAVDHGESWDIEVELVPFEGRSFWVRSVGNPLLQNGDCIKVMGIFQDIDTAKKEALALLESKNKTELISQTTADFLCALNKEIEKPLNEVLVYSGELLKGNLACSQRRDLTIVYQSAETLLALKRRMETHQRDQKVS